jgi:hypothetical protein
MPANELTINFTHQAFDKTHKPLNFAEIGVDKGDTSLELARFLNGKGTLHLFDYEDIVLQVSN